MKQMNNRQNKIFQIRHTPDNKFFAKKTRKEKPLMPNKSAERKIAGIACFVFIVFGSMAAFGDGLKPIPLSKPALDKGKTLMQALGDRRSARDFSPRDLPVEVIAGLLWAADGINRSDGKRTAPSASNVQEIDIYVAMKDGLYRYNAADSRLDPVMAGDLRPLTGVQSFAATAPLVLIFVADFSRMRGDTATKIFYSATDTGYISQNVYLFAAQEGLATVVLGWVQKEELAKAMKLGPDQRVILSQPVGYPK
ncbi:MAG: SagB/ThcOx family dehydrogenase [Candidatus Omnitrophica bacterium]|nr:SagB/ThcOx family dehydrogenase [Candidatus Omnitrophota bacterium]